MVVIHIDAAYDTKVLSKVYDGVDCTLFYNPSDNDTDAIIDAIENDDGPVVLMGHGSPLGLLNSTMSDYLIDFRWGNILMKKVVIGIWCYAAEFADTYCLHGFFTSMFVSNLNEAVDHGVGNTTDETIQSEMDWFCTEVNSYIKNEVPLSQWVDRLQASCHKEHDFVRYNYEALSYFK